MSEEKGREVGVEFVSALGQDVVVGAVGNEVQFLARVRHGHEEAVGVIGGNEVVAKTGRPPSRMRSPWGP